MGLSRQLGDDANPGLLKVAINVQTGTSYTVTASDNGGVIEFTNAATVTVTVPLEATEDLGAGFNCTLVRTGGGTVTVAPEGAVVLNSPVGLSLINQYDMCMLYKTGTDEFNLVATATSTLEDLTDTDITSAASGDVLTHNGTDWDNAVAIGTAANNLVQLNGSAQLPAVDGSLLTGIVHTPALDDLTDVDLTTTAPVTDDALVYDGANWVPGEVAAGAAAGVGSSPGFKGASVYDAGAQSVVNATWTAVNFDLEDYDSDAFHDTVTNNTRITIPITGYYSLTARISFVANATGYRTVAFEKNGDGNYIGRARVASLGSAAPTDVVTTQDLYLTAGDYVETVVYQTSGGNLDVGNNAVGATLANRMQIHKIEAAQGGGTFSGCVAALVVDQTLTTSTWTALTLETETFDTDDYHDNATNNTRITVPTTGYYQFSGRVSFTGNATGSRATRWVVDGTTNHSGTRNEAVEDGNGAQVTPSTVILYLTSGQYVELEGWQNSGGNLDVTAAEVYCTKIESPQDRGFTAQATTATLTGNSRTMADTSSASVAYTLPAGVVGEWVEVIDVEDNAATNNIVLTPASGEKVENVVDATFTVNVNSGKVQLVYTTNRGWIVGDAL